MSFRACFAGLFAAWAFVTLGVAQTLIVDNSDPGFEVLSEQWSAASLDGQYGDDYRYRSTTLPAGEVEWRPALATAGSYQVSVWYRNSNDRPSDARYTVHHAGGTTDVFVDQRINGSQWVVLGAFEFASGDAGRVTLTSAAEPGTIVVADAVRFVALSGGGDAVPELRACWLTHYEYLNKSEPELRAIAQNIRAGRMNTVYIAVYSGAQVYWPSKAYQAGGGHWASGSVDYARRLLDIFHDEGLKVGAWFEYGLALGGASHPIAVAHPEWLARDRWGDPVSGENGGFVFLSPGHPDAVEMIVGMVRELAANYDFDDIQLDRIRWARKDSGREYGYEDSTAQRYHDAYGVWPPTNVNNAQWVAFREGLVNDVMQQCYDTIKAVNPAIVVSSAPTGSYGITQHMQRWSDWVEGGYLDLVLPQMYKTSLSTFVTELNTQLDQAPDHADKIGVGYRASEDNDWGLVADQLSYARSLGVPHGCLWVYHQYGSQIAIQDEIDHLPLPQRPWAAWAYNPFTSERLVQLVIDDDDASPAFHLEGNWVASAQPDYFRFGSLVAAGGGAASLAAYGAAIPLSGRYDVYAWYTAAGNRNPAAPYTVLHHNGATTVPVDQRSGGGAWVPLGRWIFAAGDTQRRVEVSTAGSAAGVYTSADAVKLVLSGYAFGDANGDGAVDLAEVEQSAGCTTGPRAGPVGVDCEVFDFDDDGDVDLRDWAGLQTAMAP